MLNDVAEYRVYTTMTVEGYPKSTPPYINCEVVLSLDSPSYLMEAMIHQGSYKECVDFAKKYCTHCKGIIK